jgi:hypothetical protein
VDFLQFVEPQITRMARMPEVRGNDPLSSDHGVTGDE